MPPGITTQRVEHPTEAQIQTSIDLFVSLMKDDLAAISLSGGDTSLIDLMAGAILRAGIFAGEYYTATNEENELIGFTVWMPPGQEMFSTDEQRTLGLNDFMVRLPEIGKEYYKTTYLAQFPQFVARTLGPTGKLDSWWLHMCMVRSDYQRRGVARALIAHVREKAELKGENIATSTTTDKNVPVYTGLGFELKASMIMPSPWGEWPLYVFLLENSGRGS